MGVGVGECVGCVEGGGGGFASFVCFPTVVCQGPGKMSGRMSGRISIVFFWFFWEGWTFWGWGRRGRDGFRGQVVFLGFPVQVLGCLS